MTPQLQSVLAAPKAMLVGLVRIDLPGASVALCDGGFVTMDGVTFRATDPVFGAIEGVESFTDGIGDEAPGASLTFVPASTAAATELSRAEYQGSRIRFWQGAVLEATGQLIDAELVFDGELDTTVLRDGAEGRRLDLSFVSASERLMEVGEGTRLSDAFHQELWPGETGLENMTGIARKVYWGTDAPPSGISRSGGYGG